MAGELFRDVLLTVFAARALAVGVALWRQVSVAPLHEYLVQGDRAAAGFFGWSVALLASQTDV